MGFLNEEYLILTQFIYDLKYKSDDKNIFVVRFFCYSPCITFYIPNVNKFVPNLFKNIIIFEL